VRRVHLITGGTGFVGSSIILELLRQTNVEVLCLVRPTSESIDDRLQRTLLKTAQLYGYDNTILQAIKERCHAIVGDISQPLCGVNLASVGPVAQFWHCAASLRYEDRYVTEIFQTNVEGTRHALDLACRIGVNEYFNYVSTAYVAGKRTGIILEKLAGGHETHNHYEASKIQAEALVAAAPSVRTRIFRPSVVIGHSTTFAVSSGFSGLYGFMRKLLQFKGAMSRVQEGLLSREALHMRVDADGLLNLVPVDYVSRQAVQIATSSASASIFHLTNAAPITVAEFLHLLFAELELKVPLCVETREQFSWIDTKLDQGITFYNSYLIGSKTFDRQNSDTVLGSNCAGAFSLDTSTLLSYFRWYLDLLAVQRPRLIATH
jgi:thioester reductase-like protein